MRHFGHLPRILVHAVRMKVTLLRTQAPRCLREVFTLKIRFISIKLHGVTSGKTVTLHSAASSLDRNVQMFPGSPLPQTANQCATLKATRSKWPYSVATQLVRETGIWLNYVQLCVAADVSGPSHLTGRSLEWTVCAECRTVGSACWWRYQSVQQHIL